MSRTCPGCGKTFPDEVFFCGHDGTITVEDQDPADFDSRLGKQLGGYIVVARVADGAMGRVFEGRHPETKARVAIKVLHEHVAKDNISVERFKREYDAAHEMDHRNVVSVLEFGETPDDSYFLTMEYLEGDELGNVLGQGQTQAPERIIRVICQTAMALDYAHSFGFIHRDLKPDNIFLCRTDEGDDVRLLDFGSVKLQMEVGAKLTAIGTTLGSPFYMSPEQATGAADVDQRSDVFALTAILYEMLTDKVAFDGPNVAMILMKIMNETPAKASSINKVVTPALDAVIERGLAKDKGARYASALELADAVIKAYGLTGTVEQWAHTSHAAIARSLRSEKSPALAATVASIAPVVPAAASIGGVALAPPPPSGAPPPGPGVAAAVSAAPALTIKEQDETPAAGVPTRTMAPMLIGITIGLLIVGGMVAYFM